jgi:hypothetical protein
VEKKVDMKKQNEWKNEKWKRKKLYFAKSDNFEYFMLLHKIKLR